MEDEIVEKGKLALLNVLPMTEVKVENMEQIEFLNIDHLEIKKEQLSDEDTIDEIDAPCYENENNSSYCNNCRILMEEIDPISDAEMSAENLKLYCNDCYQNDIKKYVTFWEEKVNRLYKGCDFCTGVFKNEQLIVKHKCLSLLWCCKCGIIFDQIRDILQHYKICNNKPKWYFCNTCCKSYNTLLSFKKHTATCSSFNAQPYSCDICYKSFPQIDQLILHLSTHAIPFTYNIYTKSFTQMYNLETRPYKQTIINKQTHTIKNRYSCDKCLKSFSYASNLKRHIIVHSGEKPYSCDKCLKSFNYESYLKRHMLVHSGEKPYSCDICSKSFKLKSILKTHFLIHSDESPFTCNVCSKSFKCSNYLKLHLIRKHTVE